MPPDITDDELTRLGLLISEVPQREPTPPRYAREFMPAGMTPEQALRNSQPPPRRRPAAPRQPALPVVPAYTPPVPNWPWEVPAFVDIPDDEDD